MDQPRGAPCASHGSANTGVIVLRARDRRVQQLLWQWWHARNGWAWPHNIRRARRCTDQAVLWRLWASWPELARGMRVLAAPGGALPNGTKSCMHVAANYPPWIQKPSPILHVTSTRPSVRRKTFEEAWHYNSKRHRPGWCLTRVEIDVPAAARRLFGDVEPLRSSGPWFHSTVVDDAVGPAQVGATADGSKRMRGRRHARGFCSEGIVAEHARSVCCAGHCKQCRDGPWCASGAGDCCPGTIIASGTVCKDAQMQGCRAA